MKCVNSLCMKQVNTAADVLYCPICQHDGTANEINPQRFPEIHDDMPIEEVLAGHPGIGVRFRPTPAEITQVAEQTAVAPDPEPEGQTDPIPDATDPAGDPATAAEPPTEEAAVASIEAVTAVTEPPATQDPVVADEPATTVPIEEADQPDQAATPDSSPEQ